MADSAARDSTARDNAVAPDTIKAAIAQARLPVLADPGGSHHWTRATMFETGALTVQELLDRVPGLTGLRSNWIAQPILGAYLGSPGRVRVFLDGFEIEQLDPRSGGVVDLSQLSIWSLDDLVVERTASEVRIHMRSWRVDRTTPFTRTDIYTGDQNTNLYRGLFGRRYRHGEVFQLAGQQFSTTPGRAAGSSDQLGIMARLGIARVSWTADLVLNSLSRHRGASFPLTLDDTVDVVESTRRDAYLRFGWQDTARGLWAQGMAGTSTLELQGVSGSAADSTTARSRAQYVATGGYARGALSATFTQRYLVGFARHVAQPGARFGWDSRLVSASISAEGRGLDSTRRTDASVVVRPVSFAYLGVGYARERPAVDSMVGSPTFARLEAGVRLKDVWVSGGVMGRDEIDLAGAPDARAATPTVFDSADAGAFAAVRGRVWKAVHVNAHLTRWSDTLSAYRPQYQTHTEVYVSTAALHRFPTGNFHFRASVVHEYRSAILWPTDTGGIRVPGYRTISTMLQFKIVNAEAFWTYRNAFSHRYYEIPGYRLPRITSVYGVRWEFWN